jgi:hypothetical protein
MPNTDAALAAIKEAREQLSGESKERVEPHLDVAIKALRDEEITDEDLGRLHAAAETKVREALGRPRG